MDKCVACIYRDVKGLITNEELDEQILKLLSPKMVAEIVKHYGHDFPDYQSAILYGGNGELLPYSRIVDLSDMGKNHSPFETSEGRIITGFSYCNGTIDDSLDNIDDPYKQTTVAVGRLIDIARENKDGRIVMLTSEQYRCCCPLDVLEFDLAATLKYLTGNNKGI